MRLARVLVRVLVLAFAVAGAASGASPHGGDPASNPQHYICPNIDTPRALDCFLNAIDHLYTMCRHVKSIEIIEFGYERSDEGVNSAKSEYCVDKQKLSMTRPYQAALREVTGVRVAVEQVKALYEQWIRALHALKWRRGETGADYENRTVLPYVMFSEQATSAQIAMADAAAAKSAAKPKPAEKPAAAPAKAKTAAAPGTAKSAN